MCEDVNEAASILTHKLKLILDSMFPVQTIQIRARYAPWLSTETKQQMKDRDSSQKIAASSGDRDDWRAFKISEKL